MGNEGMRASDKIVCPDCCRFVGRVPFLALVTGTVDRDPGPDLSGNHGIEGYHQCPSCKRFVRWEVAPSDGKTFPVAFAA